MADVAERAGVRKPSVSVVLNGAKSNIHVSDATRERILKAAEELGYMRNGGMASVASGRFGSVALLLSTKDMVSEMPARLWEGIHDVLAIQGIHLSMFRLPDETLKDTEKAPKILRVRRWPRQICYLRSIHGQQSHTFEKRYVGLCTPSNVLF